MVGLFRALYPVVALGVAAFLRFAPAREKTLPPDMFFWGLLALGIFETIILPVNAGAMKKQGANENVRVLALGISGLSVAVMSLMYYFIGGAPERALAILAPIIPVYIIFLTLTKKD
ncbi:MAG: hypothetical protein ACYC2Y_08090 [Armatimonadota bacterium]